MRGWSQQRRLGCVLALNLLMIAGLVLAGLTAHSLGVLAAAGDFAADSVALMLGLVAVALGDRPSRPAGHRSRTIQSNRPCGDRGDGEHDDSDDIPGEGGVLQSEPAAQQGPTGRLIGCGH